LRTCQNLGKHAFLLEPNWDVYLELLQLLLDVLEEKIDVAKKKNNNPDALMKKKSKFDLHYE